MVGHVEATFLMRNQGKAEEAFDVWFPLGVPDGYSNIVEVEGFQAWVDGAPAPIEIEERVGRWESTVPWATWPATFPPGHDVLLRVTYAVRPEGYSPYGTFPYLLETGAGWWGPIGEGTITFRLPYAVNESNVVFPPEVYGDEQMLWVAPQPSDFTVSGNDVVWHFTDLEPTAEDNVKLTVLAPSAWEAIVAAREAAAETPDVAEVQWRLARALNGALSFKYGLQRIGNSAALAEQTEAAYRRALELAKDTPSDERIEIYVAYLEWLQRLTPPVGPFPEPLRPTLVEALALAPHDARLLDIQAWVEGMEPHIITPTSEGEPTATQAPAPTATAIPTATRSTTATASPAPTATAPPPPTPTSEPQAQAGGGLCPGALALTLLPGGIWIWKERKRV
jgi:hypothetical protein